MRAPLRELLARLQQDQMIFEAGEEATRQGAILPILGKIGWDRDNVREVHPEFSVGNGRVDYSLRIAEKNVVFIEVKRVGEELERHQEQLLKYAFNFGVKIGVLTNGLQWWLYLPLSEGSWEQRKFFTIDIQHQSIDSVTDHFIDLLGKEAVASGSAVERAQSVQESKIKEAKIRDAIPKAWEDLCKNPDESLLDLFAKRVEGMCGYRPDQEHLASFLREEPSKPPPPFKPEKGEPPPPPPPTNRKARAFIFKSQRHEVSTFKEVLIGLCKELYRFHEKDFDRVLKLRGRKRAYFSRDYKGMTSPEEIPGTGIYVETNLSAERIEERCNGLVVMFGYSVDQFGIISESR